MAWNRVADARIDAENPRTAVRAIPAGRISMAAGLALTLVGAAVFVVACAMLNRLCLLLSPVVLAVFLAYPYTKRFTWACHALLGVALGLAPVGAWVAVRGAFDAGVESVILLGGAVLVWVAGFDIVYACQDVEHDRKDPGLHSIPKSLGPRGALLLARGLHLLAILLFVAVGVVAGLGWIYYAAVVVAAGLLHREHAILSPEDLSKVGMAFFNLNGLVSIVVGGLAVADVLILS
jgi:4-hydroxybenzoate polyprenyltransferase